MSTTAITAIPTGTWNVDPAHSSIEFRVKHLGISTVRGSFREFEGSLELCRYRRRSLVAAVAPFASSRPCWRRRSSRNSSGSVCYRPG